MTNYYFVTSALPVLHIGMQPEISFEELMSLIELNLKEKDLEKVKVLRRYYDIENVRSFLLNAPLQKYGNLSLQQLDEAIHGFDGLPGYFCDFLCKYETADLRLKNFSSLISAYYIQEGEQVTGFLKELLDFDRKWRLVFTALRARVLGRDLLEELQYEDPKDHFVAQLIAQRDAVTFEPPKGFEELKNFYADYQTAPMELMKAVLAWRFNKIEEMLGVDLFSVDRVLGYLDQLSTLEKWSTLDAIKGLEIVDTIIREPV